MRFDNSMYIPVIEVLKGLGGYWSTLWTTDEDGWETSQDIFVVGAHELTFCGFGDAFHLHGEEEGEKLLAELTLHLFVESGTDPEWVESNKATARRSSRCRHKQLRRALRG